MSKMHSLQDLFVEELRDLYNAETQLTKALPKMADAASSSELKTAFNQHLRQTEGHITRLEQIFENLGQTPRGKVCKGMKGLIEEGEEFLQEKPDSQVMDAGLISIAQRVEHYEIAGYGCVRTYAEELGDRKSATLLEETLNEEKETDQKLTRLAESRLNEKAMAVGASTR
jgi:ferritin-like metal-binding protein YciE